MTPDTIADEIILTLKNQSDPENIKNSQRYFKQPIFTFGIRAAVIHKLAKDWLKKLRPEWGITQTIQLTDILIRQKEIDSKNTGILILAGFSKSYTSDLFPVVYKWLKQYCDNWAVVDALAPNVLGPLLGKYPLLIKDMLTWTQSPILWVRRAAVVSFLPLIRKGKYLDEAYKVIYTLLNDKEDLLHKANGWLLRELGKIDMQRLEQFLLHHNSLIPRTTIRYAIERFPFDERQRLLKETR